MIAHVVLFKLAARAEAAAVDHLRTVFAAMREKIPGIADFAWSGNTSPEGLGQGYDLGFVMTFASAADRDAYLIHSEHEAVHPLVEAVAEEVLVFDIES